MTIIEVITLITIFLLVGFWEYTRSFQLRGMSVRYEHGFAFFALIGWILSCVALIKIFGIAFGLLATAGVLMVLQYVTHFSIGLILYKVSPQSSDLSLAGFSILVWVLALMTLLLFVL